MLYANRATNPSTSTTCTRTSLPTPAMSALHVQLQTTPTTVASHSRSNSCSQPVTNPFMLKFKTNNIRSKYARYVIKVTMDLMTQWGLWLPELKGE